MFDEANVWLPRVHLECDFHNAARLDDLLEVSVYVGRIGNSSMRLNFEVRRKGEEMLVATAHFVLATVNSRHLRLFRFPRSCENNLPLIQLMNRNEK